MRTNANDWTGADIQKPTPVGYRRLNCLGLIGCGLVLLAWPSRGADPMLFQSNKVQAVTAAMAENKLVLLIAGREDCANCTQLEYAILPSINPPLRQFVEEALVYWQCRQDLGYADYMSYVPDLTDGFPIPLICVVDPKDPDNYLMRGFGGAGALDFLTLLRKTVLQHTAPLVTNVAGGYLPAGADSVQGRSRYFNLPIRYVWYQLNDDSAWNYLPASTNGQPWATDWSIPLNKLALKTGTNTLRLYVKDGIGYRSQTNTVSLRYGLPPPPASTPTKVAITAPTINQTMKKIQVVLNGATPGQAYTLQRTAALLNASTIWSNVTTATATNPAGVIFFSETNPPSPSFYRAVAR
jgi:hypothetical protein